MRKIIFLSIIVLIYSPCTGQSLGDSLLVGRWIRLVHAAFIQERDTLILSKNGNFKEIVSGDQYRTTKDKHFFEIIKGKWELAGKYFKMMPPDSNDINGKPIILDKVHYPTIKYTYKMSDKDHLMLKNTKIGQQYERIN